MSVIKKKLKKILPSTVVKLIRTDIQIIKEGISKKKNQKKLVEIVRQKKIKNQLICIELGSAIPRPNWITIDLDKSADIFLDLSCSLPLNSNSVDIIYTSHLLEHFNYRKLLELLLDIRRILKIDGELSVCVPNAEIFTEAYKMNDEKLKNVINKINHFEHHISRIDLINYIAYMGGHHKYMFEMENLIAILNHVGFRKVVKREFQKNLDLEIRIDESIYISAIK